MAVTKYDDRKQPGEERGNFILKLVVHHEGKLGGTLLTGLFPVLTQLVYYRPQDLGVTPPTEDWTLPQQENAPQTCLQTSLLEVFSQMRVPLLR